MFENIMNFFKKLVKTDKKETGSREAAKERLHLVLMQDRANVSADFLELMKQEIIDVIKKYIEVDEKEIDVRLTNKENDDGTNGAPALYANIPILNIKNEMKKEVMSAEKKELDSKMEELKKADEINNKAEEAMEEKIEQAVEIINEVEKQDEKAEKAEEKQEEKIETEENSTKNDEEKKEAEVNE